MHTMLRSLLAAALGVGLFSHAAAFAQSAGCAMSRDTNARQVLSCPGGVKVTAEAGASFRLADRNRDGSPDSLSLRSKAVLVDVESGKTSVLVVRGSVAVRRPAGEAVVLSPGEGVDVGTGTEPLVVRRWPGPRAAALLARLGQ